MSEHAVTFLLEVDEAAIERHREAYLEELDPDFNPDEPEGPDLDFYGQPAEWRSLIHLLDANEAGVILRSELVHVKASTRDRIYAEPRARQSWRGWLARRWPALAIGIIVALVYGLVVAAVANAALIEGGPGSDTLRGTRHGDVIRGYGGHDDEFGGGGNDVLFGHRGRDYLKGGEGADGLYGGRGNDFIAAAGQGIDDVVCGLGDADFAVVGPLDFVIGCEDVIEVQP